MGSPLESERSSNRNFPERNLEKFMPHTARTLHTREGSNAPEFPTKQYNYFSPTMKEMLHYSEVKLDPISPGHQNRDTGSKGSNAARKSVY